MNLAPRTTQPLGLDSPRRESEALVACPRRHVPWLLLAVLTAVVVGIGFGSEIASAQEEKHRKVPGLDKVITGSSEQAFLGKVQSFDQEHSVLNVSSTQGSDTEIFPVKKNVHVATADGDKLKLAELRPGTTVMVHYEQKGDRRQVKQITIIDSSPVEQRAKKKNSRHS